MHHHPVGLIGDVVASRHSTDRVALHRALSEALIRTNAEVMPETPLAITAGDEFQGVYATWGAALEASHLIRLRLAGFSDARFGLGRGAITTLDAVTGVQDGPGWWAARAAIEQVKDLAQRGAHASLRTGLVADADAPPLNGAMRAAALLIDRALAELDATSRTIVLGIVRGRQQAEIAQQLGLSPQAVSKRIVRGQLQVLCDALRSTWEAT